MTNNSVEIIAEIAQAHDGSLGIAHSYIDALAGSGVDTIKFQMHIAEAESSADEQFRVNFSYEDKTRYAYWERMEFTIDEWAGLKKHTEDKGFRFLCSPFSIRAVEWMEQIGSERYKIASGEMANYLMLDKICKTRKPILLSSGMSSFDEISHTIEFIQSHSGKFEGVFQCTTAYPTPPEKYGLNVLQELKQSIQTRIGLSDHSGEIYAPLAAVALGAEMLEMHVVFDKLMFGPDAPSSLSIQDFRQLCSGVRKIESALNNPVQKNQTAAYSDLKVMFGKSLTVRRDLKKGHVIQLDDLESTKPGDKGIGAHKYYEAIGKTLNKDLSKTNFLQHTDLQ
jgi:N,N'-diacetyllegionaminate synthase